MLRTLVISLCLAGLAVAQTAPAPSTAPRSRGRGPGPGRGGPAGPGGRGPGGSLFGPNAESRLTKQLGLDAAQQNTLHTALLSATVQQQGMKEKMSALRTQLATAVKAGDEGTIDKTTQDIATLNQQQSAIHLKTISKVYTSLNATQKTKFEPQMNRDMGLPGQRPAGRGPAGRGPRPGANRTPTSIPVTPQQQ